MRAFNIDDNLKSKYHLVQFIKPEPFEMIKKKKMRKEENYKRDKEENPSDMNKTLILH